MFGLLLTAPLLGPIPSAFVGISIAIGFESPSHEELGPHKKSPQTSNVSLILTIISFSTSLVRKGLKSFDESRRDRTWCYMPSFEGERRTRSLVQVA